ncbi:MAG: hypothetical protein C4305_02035 [Thermoleophilia bacterium]
MGEEGLAEDVAGEAVGKLGQSIGGERGDDEEISPLEVGVRTLLRTAAGQGQKRLPSHEAIGPARDEGDDLVASAHEQADELARLVGGDAAGDAEEDLGHERIVPSRQRQSYPVVYR